MITRMEVALILIGILILVMTLGGCGDYVGQQNNYEGGDAESLPAKMEFQCKIDQGSIMPQVTCWNDLYNCSNQGTLKIVCELINNQSALGEAQPDIEHQ